MVMMGLYCEVVGISHDRCLDCGRDGSTLWRVDGRPDRSTMWNGW